MEKSDRAIKKHLFICCNERETGDFCASKNPKDLIKKLKMRLREDGKWDEIRVTPSGCLGPCSQGISAVLFPENQQLTQIELDSEDEIYKLLTED